MIVEQILSGILVAVASYCKRKTAQKMPARVAADRGVKQKYSSYVLMTFSGLLQSRHVHRRDADEGRSMGRQLCLFGGWRSGARVAVPTATTASDITETSYTANWEAGSRSSGFTVNNYGVTCVTEATSNYVLLSEDFSGITEDVTWSTDPTEPDEWYLDEVMTLDDYTSLPGWTALGVAMSVGMFGACEDYSGYYLMTPEIYFGNNTTFKMYIKAYGTAGDGLVMYVGDKVSGAYFSAYDDDGNGIINATYVFDCPYERDYVKFYTLDGGAFLIDEVTIMQDLSAGALIHTYLSTDDVDSDVYSYTFDNLDFSAYDDYAYSVQVYLSEDGDYAESGFTDFCYVSGEAVEKSVETDIAVVECQDKTIYEVARYTVDGKRITGKVKGINIVRMSDGSVRKEIVKN